MLAGLTPSTPGSDSGGAKTRVHLQGAMSLCPHMDGKTQALKAQTIEVIIAIKAVSCRGKGAKSCFLFPAEEKCRFLVATLSVACLLL